MGCMETIVKIVDFGCSRQMRHVNVAPGWAASIASKQSFSSTPTRAGSTGPEERADRASVTFVHAGTRHC